MEKLLEFKEWIGYILAIIFLGMALLIYFTYDSKLTNISVKYSNEGILSSIEASDNAKSIYEFSKYQLDEGIIDNKGYSDSIGKLVITHDRLINMVKSKAVTDANDEAVIKAIEFLTVRKAAYENLKSAVDMNAENFNIVAMNKFSEAEGISADLKIMIATMETK